MTSSTVVDTPLENPGNEPARARTRGRRGAAAGRAVLFLALGAVVLSFGLVAGNGGASSGSRSFSEIAAAQARSEARSLAAEARVLAAASSGRSAEEFQAQAEGLRVQAALLGGTGREPAAAATRDSSVEPLFGSGASASAETPDAGRLNIERYLQALEVSAQTNLHSAWRADAGTARLLAAAGTAQRVWAQRIADLSGLPLPESSAGTDAAGTGARDNGTATSGQCDEARSAGDAAAAEGAGEGPDAAAALRSAIDAELGTAYAYEVALAQVEPAAGVASDWRARLKLHESHGMDAVDHLAALCLPPVAPVAAYRLDDDFLADPAGSLPALEQQFPAVYADLVALSEGELRGWAIARLTAAGMELYRDADTVPATPGLDAVPDDLPWN